ncbi:MAG: condensation domain-containing protein [Rhodobacter sp.]|nr:condensation domain-containing protein [Rhodobacter sp.]
MTPPSSALTALEPMAESIQSYPPSSQISFNQEQICLLEAFYPGTRAYNAQLVVHLNGAFDPATLERAVNDVIARHESLRTTITLQARGYQAQVHPQFHFKVDIHDISDVPEARQEDRFAALKAECTSRTFDLETLPLMDIRAVRFRADKWRLIHVEHHAIHDGWSLGLLWHEIQQTYNALKKGRTPRLAAPPVQYQQFVAWQRARMQGDYGRQAISFWRDYLDGTSPEISISSRHSDGSSLDGRNYEVNLSPDRFAAVKAAARRFSVSNFVVMFSVFSALLAKASGETDFAVGTAVNARTEVELEPMIGMVVNTVPLRVRVQPGEAWRSVCRTVQSSLFRALRYQDLPLSHLIRELGVVQKKGKNPIFQHCFSFHDSRVPKIEMENIDGYIKETQNQTAKFDINVIVIPASADRGTVETRMFWQFSDSLFSHEDCCQLIEEYLILLGAISEAE